MNNEVKKLKEKELLLLQYPDLYGPIPIQKDTDIIKDMEMQIQANRYRIELLEQQNQTLKSSMQRLIETERPQSTNYNTENYQQHIQNEYQVTRPVPLFKLEHEISEPEVSNQKISHTWSQKSSIIQNNIDTADSDHVFVKVDTPTGIQNYNSRHDFDYSNLLDRKNDEQNSVRTQASNFQNVARRNSVTGSNRVSNNNNNDSYRHRNITPISTPVKDMEMLIGKGHRPNSASRPPSSAATLKSSPSSNRPNSNRTDQNGSKNKFFCERCNKSYNNKKDVDIHKLYCNK